MTRFYEAYRELYVTLYDDATHDFVAFHVNDGKISALRTTLSEAETLLRAMEQAYHEVRAKGGDTRTWLREIRRATFVTGAVRDLLIEAEDGSEQIIAAREAIDAVNVELAGIAKDAEALARDLGNASAGIDAVAKLVKLID